MSNEKQTGNDFKEKTSQFFKKVTGEVQKSAKAIAEKTKNDSYIRRMKKFNPVFPDQFNSESFNLPNMIEIVDDAVRRGIDVCEGSIGWISKEGEMEVFHLYDEWIKQSGIRFIPTATCDTIYYVDAFARDKFTRIDCIFGKAHEERLAELERIAYLLGAKRCSIEIVEENIETTTTAKQFASKYTKERGSSGKEDTKESFSFAEEYENKMHNLSKSRVSGKTSVEFEGSSNPIRPELKWFENDDNVKGLIDMRCNGNNSVKSRTLVLEGASSATMSQKTACAIDSAVAKMQSKTVVALENLASREHNSKLLFVVEF